MSTTKKMVVEWKGNLRLTAKNEKGLTVNFDAPKEHGGEETALSPMENVLASLASCSSFHVLTILKKKRLNVTCYSVEAEAERRATQSIHQNPPQIHR
jgi:putative redox protein